MGVRPVRPFGVAGSRLSALAKESLAANGNTPNDQCSNGQDDDRDSFVDCEDWDCSYDPLVTVCDGPGICDY